MELSVMLYSQSLSIVQSLNKLLFGASTPLSKKNQILAIYDAIIPELGSTYIKSLWPQLITTIKVVLEDQEVKRKSGCELQKKACEVTIVRSFSF
jgi:hypothetical protein